MITPQIIKLIATHSPNLGEYAKPHAKGEKISNHFPVKSGIQVMLLRKMNDFQSGEEQVS